MESRMGAREWYRRAQVDYTQYYLCLYVAFNSWYRELTGKRNDREALNILIHDAPFWTQYCSGSLLFELRQYMEQLVDCTQRDPISHATPH